MSRLRLDNGHNYCAGEAPRVKESGWYAYVDGVALRNPKTWRLRRYKSYAKALQAAEKSAREQPSQPVSDE